jgi:rubrerythrin
MAWYKNHYVCEECGNAWDDEWSAACDDDCPHCDARHMEALESDDLTEL